MEIRLHNGKMMKVSEKKFNEFSQRKENNLIWLEFRMKVFGFSKEELIMNPKSYIIFDGKDERLKAVYFSKGRFYGGNYCDRHLREFDTPQEAYEFAYSH